jgi:outer membrane protein TolC
MIKRTQIFLSFAVSLAFLGSAFAQNGEILTLKQCVEIAMKNNSTYKSAAYRVDAAGANVKASYSSVLPRLGMSFGTSRGTVGQTISQQTQIVTGPVTFIDQNGAPVTPLDPGGNPTFLVAPRTDANGQVIIDRTENFQPTRSFYNHSLGLSLNQTLFDFGRSWNSIRQQQAGFDAATEDLRASRLEVHSSVRERYYALIKALRLEAEFREAVERSQHQLSRTKSMYEIGSVAQIDVYRQEVTLGTDQINLINPQNTVEIARGNLNVAMGRDPETSLRIVEVEPTLPPLGVTLNEAFETAVASNPQLQSFEYDMKSAEYGRKVAKNNYFPTLSLGANYSRSNDKLGRVYGALDENYFFNVGLNFSVNIFNGFSDAAEVTMQSANYKIAEENWTSQKRTLYLQVKQAYLNLEAFKQISGINETNLRSAEEEYRLAQERYRVGAGTQLEVTEAQVSLTRARVTLVAAKFDALIAQAQLEAAMGTIEEN